jgi:hypothetical protein
VTAPAFTHAASREREYCGSAAANA